MKTKYLLLSAAFTILYGAVLSQTVKHNVECRIDPRASYIHVKDSLFFDTENDFLFRLNAGFKIITHSKNVKIELLSKAVNSSDIGMDRDDAGDGKGVLTNLWSVVFKRNRGAFFIEYEGKVDSVLKKDKNDYQRGFTESPGIICDSGVYLAGSTYWLPTIKDHLTTFVVSIGLPSDWKSVSQGERLFSGKKEGKHVDIWKCDKPQEEVFLIAAKFTEYGYTMNNGVKAMAFLRIPDRGLSNKYLEATEQYMNMYEKLIAKYPYSKFALVENFWETGYGMPSFTLLGEKIIRFPFILHSSYPHELLHNWWGNSVYVDFDKGNWCEGTTAYMADHMMKEQMGRGEEYRRSTLQKFTDFVNDENDFPLSEFASRYNASSEAIGYGKALMMWHMLRRKVGDETFKKGMTLFYQTKRFEVASYDDIRRAMEQVSAMDLKPFFNRWVLRKGAPELAISKIETDRYNNGYRLFITLKQVQPEDVFVLDVPLGVATEKGVEIPVVKMTRREQTFELNVEGKPLKLAVDPQYDLFRRLNPKEVPPAMSKALASKNNVIVLPSKTPKNKAGIYKYFAEKWQDADNDKYQVVYDNNLKSLPEGKTLWILGFENRFAKMADKELKHYNSSILNDSVVLEGKSYKKKGNDFIINVRNPEDETLNVVFIAIDNKNAVAGLVRKLPHYGKYGYLAFEGDEPVNIAKGQWPVLNSPLVKVFDKKAQNITIEEKREPLAVMQTIFSKKRMMETVKFLSGDELKGRGLGTVELDKAASYIAQKFKEAGLKPLGDSYFQEFDETFPGKGKLHLKNVVAVIPGTSENLKDSPVVISAHYDHLGLGWPDVHKGDEGKIHHGADDNASGVSIMLELAKTMGKTLKPKRTIIFVAFTGEEAGLKGSRYFVSKIKNYFKGDIMADINLDTDGRLSDGKLLVLNGNSAKEWKFIFMGTDYTTGVKSTVVLKQLDSSDQLAFIEKGIPAVQLFTGATADYHRPSDTWDKIDADGLVKVATVTKEVLEYLADRAEPLEYRGDLSKSGAGTTVKTKKSRRVSTGSIPDFTFQGKGVKIGSVIEGSPAEKAGLKKGDIIVSIDGKEVKTLKEYSDTLKTYKPGDKIVVAVVRSGKKIMLPVVLGAR